MRISFILAIVMSISACKNTPINSFETTPTLSWYEICHMEGEVLSDVQIDGYYKNFDFKVSSVVKAGDEKSHDKYQSRTGCYRYVGHNVRVSYIASDTNSPINMLEKNKKACMSRVSLQFNRGRSLIQVWEPGCMEVSEYVPIVKVAPNYPKAALDEGVSGICVVEYTVSESGGMKDIKPVHCKPEGTFEHESVQAVRHFIYKPKIINGRAVSVKGVRHRFTFSFE